MEKRNEIVEVEPKETNIVIKEEKQLISDEDVLKVYNEIMEDLRNDRKEVDELLGNFVEMVINEGDSTSASKEALVNLVKIKTDLADKKAKIADLITRIKLRERDTMPLYLKAKQQQNHIVNIGSDAKEARKALLKAIKENKEKNDE